MNKLTLEQIPGEAFLNRNGQQQGPYNVDQINDLLSAGQVQRTDSIWIQGWTEWKQLSHFLPPAPPSPPPQRASVAAGEKPTIYITKDGQQLGPFTLEEINSKLSNKTLLESDLAWTQGWPEWVPLSSVPGVLRSISAPPFPATPPPPALGAGSGTDVDLGKAGSIDIASLDVSPAWKGRFLLMQQLGWNGRMSSIWSNSSRSRKLPPDQRSRVRRLYGNGWAFFFGPFYYFTKGMWQKGLFILGIAFCIIFTSDLIKLPWLGDITGFMAAAFYLTMANYDFYLLKVYRKPWYFTSTRINVAVIGTLCLLLLVLGFADSGASSDEPTSTSSGAAAPGNPANPLGETAPAALPTTVILGDLTIQVTRFETRSSIGGSVFATKASPGAVFVLVYYTITNDSNETKTDWSDNDFSLEDSQNRKFSPSSDALTALVTVDSRKDFMLTELQPGVTKPTVTAFEVPLDSTRSALTFTINVGGDEKTVALPPSI